MATKSTPRKATKKSTDLTVEFEFDRDTKNTFRFAEVSDAPVIKTLYVQRSAFPNGAPNGLTVTISES